MTENKNDNEKLVNETVEEMKQKIELISSEADKVEGDSKVGSTWLIGTEIRSSKTYIAPSQSSP